MLALPSVKTIDSPQNPLIKATAKLRTRRGREQRGLIIIDGTREVMRAVEAGVNVQQLLVCETKRGKKNSWSEWFHLAETDVFTVSDRAFAKIAFGERQEVVAVTATPSRSLDKIVLGESPCIAVLEGVEKPGNVGAVLRSADGAGLEAIVIVEGGTDLFNPNTIRASLGTIFSQQVVTASFREFAAWSKAHAFMHLLARVDGKNEYTAVNYQQSCAIVLGSESSGLTQKWQTLPHETIQLPMHGVGESLNVSATAAILFYEAHRCRR
jgi:TrmH family RNA methyltransferase